MLPAVSVIPQWFRRRKGVAYSFVGAGSSLGGVIYPIVARKLIPQVGYAAYLRSSSAPNHRHCRFQWTMRTIGFMQLALLIPTCLFIARNFPPKKNLPPLSLVHYRNPAFSFYCAAAFIAYLVLFTVRCRDFFASVSSSLTSSTCVDLHRRRCTNSRSAR